MVDQLTVQIQELQDRVNYLDDARDFKQLETASSCHVSARTPVFRVFTTASRRLKFHVWYMEIQWITRKLFFCRPISPR